MTWDSNALPASVRRLFWDIELSDLQLDAHSDYVLERVMQKGGYEAMMWLRRAYTVEVMAEFLRRKGERLAPRERAYWHVIAGLERVLEPGGGRPRWADGG